MDFRGEAGTRATERLPFLPPFAPAADPCARTIVESNIGMRCADESSRRACRGERVEEGFDDASLAQSVEAFPYAVARTEAFRQGAPPNILDREEVERFEETAIVAAFRPPRGRQARNTASACAQSSSLIFVNRSPGLRFGRGPMNHN